MKRAWLTVLLFLVGVSVLSFASDKRFVVGFSLGAYGWPWRTQHVEDFKLQAEKYKAAGLIKNYYIRVAGGEVAAQIADIRDLLALGVDLLIINPNSATALNPVIKQAHDMGALVIAQDQHVTSEYAYNVVIDHAEWFADITKWVCEQLGGKGNIVIVTGITGHPANEERMRGCFEVLKNYPDINVLAVVEGAWNFDVAEKNMAPIIAAYRGRIDAVLAQDGHFLGIVRAFEAAGITPGSPEFPKIMTTDYTLMCVQKWYEILQVMPDFKGYMRLNTPAYSADALMFAVRLAQGKQINWDYERVKKPGEMYPGVTFLLPLPPAITNEDVPKLIEEYKYQTATYQIDYILSEEEVDAYFKQ
ncbi:MAG: substrate-binding domain-containing protein [Candidatus Hadarchaeum sp.]|uniref:substrate-binding domain-containing protein n=1 Tax=Candidatus Hadarchaeum sp. TaxID=2883567 RepID=UPI0031713D29